MSEPSLSGENARLTMIVRLLTANLIVMAICAGGLVLGLLPRLERAIQATERVEVRFHEFADSVQPVLESSAAKAAETIRRMDADSLSETATESTKSVMGAAAERARNFLKRKDTPEDNEPYWLC